MIRTLCALVLLALTGCGGCGGNYEHSDTMSEHAKVVQITYTPSQHGSSTGVAFTNRGAAPTFSSIDVPEKYSIVFECQHGKFVIEDEHKGSRAHLLWQKLHEGQEVEVIYQEVYQKKSDLNEHKRLLKYKFIDAIPIKKD